MSPDTTLGHPRTRMQSPTAHRPRHESRLELHDQSSSPTDYWLVHSQTFLVDTVDGDAVGVVEDVRIDPRTVKPVAIDVSCGWLGRRRLTLPVTSVSAVLPSTRRLLVRTDAVPRTEPRPSRLRSRSPRRLARPVERFLAQEAGSASLLLAAAVTALLWANLGGTSYERFWNTDVGFPVESHGPTEGLHLIVNDLLMAVFFYVVALEVKREIVFGGLRDRRAAAVPVAAALGTMAGAAATYAAVNLGSGGDMRGWAIPIATDIAFAIAALGLVGRRAPRTLRVFLLTLAVVDDLGTIAVIAIFFAKGISLVWLAAAGVVVVATVVALRRGIRSLAVYLVLAGALWYAAYESGVHATIAGVVLGFLTPATTAAVRRVRDEARSPLTRMETALHPVSAYAILPVFALANAGVPISREAMVDALTGPIGLGILLGLVVGAPLGGILFARAAVSLGPARLPDGLDWPAIAGVAPLKGIGFTVAIFITGLTFEEQVLHDAAVLAILVASAAAGLIGVASLQLRHVLTRRPVQAPGSGSG